MYTHACMCVNKLPVFRTNELMVVVVPTLCAVSGNIKSNVYLCICLRYSLRYAQHQYIYNRRCNFIVFVQYSLSGSNAECLDESN